MEFIGEPSCFALTHKDVHWIAAIQDGLSPCNEWWIGEIQCHI